VNSERVAHRIDEGVGRLRLTHAAKRNAIDHALTDAALAAMAAFVDAGVQVVVLEADGPVFCAGNDLAEAQADRHNAASDRFVAALLDTPLFFVAAMATPAYGAGVSIAACCPIVVATHEARFALPERDVGLFPAGVLQYLEPLLGVRRAFEIGLSGTPLDAATAADVGLITEAVAPAELEHAVARWTALLTARPDVAAAGRDAWQQRFRTTAVAERTVQLRAILDAQSFDNPDDRRTDR
jgi:enoyl-CoA hydratase/carnithine racemase